MKNGFTAEKDLSQVSPQTSESELTPRQNKIYRNLQDIGPEIAAFYRDGVKMLRSDNFETAPYLLAHITREIDGGLRDILSSDEDKAEIQKRLTKEILAKIGDYNTLKEYRGHIASILAALHIDDVDVLSDPNDANIRFAVRWIEVAPKLVDFVHRHGPWKPPRSREEFEHLWYDFEEVLADLVGSYLNLLKRLDRILAYKAPTKEIIGTLPNLLESEARQAYFFRELTHLAWLKPLKDAGWFDPEKNPLPYEDPDNPGYRRIPIWYALEYVETIANHPERPIDLLVDIVNTIVDYANGTEKRIENDGTNRRLIEIIGTLPIDQIGRKHIAFMGTALKYGWVSRAITEITLPKILNEGKKDLSLDLLKVMFNAKIVNRQIHPVMEEYWLQEAIKQQEQAISELCGVAAAQIALECIRTLVDKGTYSFDFIERIETEPSYGRQQRYDELLVSFTCRLFHLASPDNIAETVKSLLKESIAVNRNHQDEKGSPAIFGRIALNIITHHYNDLKGLFWEWEGNPLEKYELKPQLYQLIQTHCLNFNESEIDQILYWIESDQYYTVLLAEDSEKGAKAVAIYKREWLTALLATGNEKVITAYRHYEQINPVKIESPGLSRSIRIGYEEMSVMKAAELSKMSNAEIAQYLNDSQEKQFWADSIHGLVKTLRECVETNPRRFTDDLQPFQGVRYQYQHSILSGLRNAWRDKREFDWSALFKFIDQILLSEQFWTEHFKEPYNYRNWILSTTADLIAEGTRDDKHAFDAQLLPIAEKILMILVEKAEPSISISKDLRFGVLNSVRGKVFSAMVHYALRYARINTPKQVSRWSQTIRKDFTKRLNRSLEPSFEFSFTLGNYLPNLLYLDKEWVVDNIDSIFPRQDESHWEAAFSGYLFLPQTPEDLYFLLKKRGDYQKALNTDFADQTVLERLIQHVCWDWIEDRETLNDENSLIYQLINSGNPKLLSEMVHFFWKQQDDTSDKIKSKVRQAWRALIKVLSPNSAKAEYQEILSSLCRWLELIDKIDTETLEWLKLSAKYVERGFDSASFAEVLRKHVSQTPKEVGVIYLEMLNNKVYLDYAPTDIQETIHILYNQGYKEDADEICNLYAAAGFDFLRSLYEEYQH